MSRLSYSEDNYFALRCVSNERVVHHDPCEPHPPGFSWRDTDMSDWLQDIMRDLLHAGLIAVGRHEPWGALVLLSFEGSARLSEWSQRSLGSAS